MTHDDLFDLADSYSNQYIDFKQFVEHYRGEKSPNTIATYMSFLSNINFDPEDKEELEMFDGWARERARRKHGKSDENRSTRKRFIYFSYLALQDYLDTLEEGSQLKDNLPDSDSFEPVDSNPNTLHYSEEQIQKIVETADQKLGLAIQLGFSGLRAIEVLNITPEWMEFTEEHIEVEIPPKFAKSRKDNNKPEFTVLRSELEESIKQHILNQYEDYEDYQKLYEHLSEEKFEPLFDFHPDGESDKEFLDRRKEHKHLNRVLKKCARKSGINKAEAITFHKLRTSFIHDIHENRGLALNKTQALARHSSAETTSKYYLSIDKQEKINAHQEAYGN